jgi:hypothetical protein
MINDRRMTVSVTSLVAWFLWLVVAICMVTALVIHEHAVVHAFLIVAVGLVVATGAATVHIRAMLCTFTRNLRETFEMGREVEREQHQRMRSVR